MLADFIMEGLVVYHLLDGALGGSGQMAVYNDCIQRYKGQATWLGAAGTRELGHVGGRGRGVGQLVFSELEYKMQASYLLCCHV